MNGAIFSWMSDWFLPQWLTLLCCHIAGFDMQGCVVVFSLDMAVVTIGVYAGCSFSIYAYKVHLTGDFIPWSALKK